MAKTKEEKLQEQFPQLFSIKPNDFESVFQVLGSAQIPNMYVLSGDIVSIVRWVRMRLGEPVLPVQITNDQIALMLEEAYLQFSAEINSSVAQNMMLDVYGKDKYTNLTEKTVHQSYTFFYDAGNGLADQTMVGGNSDVRKGYISLTAGTQDYSMLSSAYDDETGQTMGAYLAQNNIKTPLQVTKIYHELPLGFYGYENLLMNQFLITEFGTGNQNGIYGSSSYYQMFPSWNDALWKSHLKQANELRRSSYSFNMYGSNIQILPCPRISTSIYFEYRMANSNNYELQDGMGDQYFNKGINSLSNIPLFEIPYELINSIGKNWIRKYCLGLCKELLGNIRNTFTSGIYIPTGDTATLNGDQLINDGKEEQLHCVEDLKAWLEKFDMTELINKRAQQNEALVQIMSTAPSLPMIG